MNFYDYEAEDAGFEILDFPCNQFGNQAPGTTEEMKCIKNCLDYY